MTLPSLADGDPGGDAGRYWPQWRGPLGTGVAPHGDPPVEWSESKNIRWKTALPGLGHSTPIVWGDRVFLTTAVPYGDALEPRYGLSANIVASPVAADGMVYAASSYDRRAMLAIRLDGAQGDISGTDQVVWRRVHRTPYVPSPLLYGDSLYFLRHYQGILSRVDAKTGDERYGPFRLDGIRNVYCSPVGAANRVYVTDRNGATMVFSHDPNPRPLAQPQALGLQPAERHLQRLGRHRRQRTVSPRTEEFLGLTPKATCCRHYVAEKEQHQKTPARDRKQVTLAGASG